MSASTMFTRPGEDERDKSIYSLEEMSEMLRAASDRVAELQSAGAILAHTMEELLRRLAVVETILIRAMQAQGQATTGLDPSSTPSPGAKPSEAHGVYL